MDSISQTPSNPAIQALIDALRWGKGKLAELPIVGEKGSWLHENAPEMLIPEGGLGVLQNAAEGHMPWRVPEGSRIPQIRQDVGHTRGVGDIVDAAGMLPIGAVAKGAPAGMNAAALYANALRKDLILSTAAEPRALLRNGQVTSELTNPSFAVTKNAVSEFDSNPLVLVPREGVFDPKTANTSLHAYDAFSPRRIQATEMTPEAFEYAKASLEMKYANHPELLAKGMQELLKDQANRRLVDRFLPVFAEGGRRTEGLDKSFFTELPRYGEGRVLAPNEMPYQFAPELTLDIRSYGPRFQNFKHYETDPRGAARLDSGTDAGKVKFDIEKLVDEARNNVGGPLENLDDVEVLQHLLRGSAGPENRARAIDLYKQLQRTRSEYGELKAWGPVGLHAENFPGALVMPYDTGSAQVVGDILRKRGIEVLHPDDMEEAFDMARYLSQKGTSPTLRTTRPTKPTRAAVQPEELTKINAPAIKPKIPVGEATEMPNHWAFNFAQLPEHIQNALDAVASSGKLNIKDFMEKIYSPKATLSDLTEHEIEFLTTHDIPSPITDKISASFSFD